MINSLIVIWFTLFVIAAIVLLVRGICDVYYEDEYDEEIIETTTTVTETKNYQVVGKLPVQYDINGQPFVIDPVDQMKIWVNSGDDMYEDAHGKVWELEQ